MNGGNKKSGNSYYTHPISRSFSLNQWGWPPAAVTFALVSSPQSIMTGWPRFEGVKGKWMFPGALRCAFSTPRLPDYASWTATAPAPGTAKLYTFVALQPRRWQQD